MRTVGWLKNAMDNKTSLARLSLLSVHNNVVTCSQEKTVTLDMAIRAVNGDVCQRLVTVELSQIPHKLLNMLQL